MEYTTSERGSNSTACYEKPILCNGYEKDIWAHVGGDQWYMKSASYQGTVGNITAGVDIKFEWDKADKNEYKKIAPKSFEKCTRATRAKTGVTPGGPEWLYLYVTLFTSCIKM
jgi:hypothetical protein